MLPDAPVIRTIGLLEVRVFIIYDFSEIKEPCKFNYKFLMYVQKHFFRVSTDPSMLIQAASIAFGAAALLVAWGVFLYLTKSCA